MGINQEWEKVKQFQERFGHPVGQAPQQLSAERAAQRYKWMLEELNEFINAQTLVDQADAMLDLIYFALGTMVEMGIAPEELFDIVHTANMAKLWEDGKPHYNEEGKTIKPASWQDPYPKLKAAIAAYTAQKG